MKNKMLIQENVNLQKLNTFHLNEETRFFCKVSCEEELIHALNFAESESLPVLILGGGSNILLSGPFRGLTIHIQNQGIRVLQSGNDRVRIAVSAGENWHSLVMHCLNQGWSGLENLSLIPGSVGAAPMQNIGAYGVEAGQWIHSLRYYHRLEKCWKELAGSDCQFAYRESIFKKELKDLAVIWEVQFELSLQPYVNTGYGDIQQVLKAKGVQNPDPKSVSEAVCEIRQSKLPDPDVLGNAGSFFKNPVLDMAVFQQLQKDWPDIPSYPAGTGMVKIPAGWLLEKAGWKGYREGNCGVHEKQALVLVNYGNASGYEILQLAKKIIADLEIRMGLSLHPEVNVI